VELLKESAEHPDAALVAECQNGDPAAFEELVRRYKDRVYNVVYRFLGNHEDAQDVAQEVFVRAYQGMRGFRGSARLYTWLYSIAGNLARNKLRDAGRKGRNRGASLEALQAKAPDVAQRAVRSDATPLSLAQSKELEEILQAALEELPEHYRLTFVMRTFDNLSYDEIAESMGCPKGTVKSRLNQARMLLRERLKDSGVLP
jgi:RNA polymerase sigma-70 factor (ECF subfamily)